MTDFPQATFEMWRARVGDIEKLVSHTADGIRIEPLYQQVNAARADRATYGSWGILQRVDHPNAAKANGQALEDLENGATGLVIARDFDAQILNGVALHAIHVRLEGGGALAKAFAGHVKQQPIDPARLNVTFGLSVGE
jgi:methylmalonyl-CoA mutase